MEIVNKNVNIISKKQEEIEVNSWSELNEIG